MPLQANAEAFGRWTITREVVINCSVDDAWSLITDITRIGEFSPECIAAVWTSGNSPAVGNRFDGTNRVVFELNGERFERLWTRPCTITACEQPSRFAYTVGDRYDGSPASGWEFNLAPVGERRSSVSQTFRHHPDGLSAIRHQADADPSRVDEIIVTRTENLATGMTATLAAMKAVLEDEVRSARNL